MADHGTSPAPGYRRSLPIESVAPRRRRHTVAGGLIAGYLLAAAGTVAAHGAVAVPQWLALHLLALGAASNAVLVYSRHFAQALLHARPGSERPAHLRLTAFNAGVVAVLAGVSAGQEWLSVAGAVLVVAAVVAHSADLVAMARAATLSGRLRVVVRYYVAGGAALAVGATLGGVLAAGWIPSARWQQAVFLAHAHLNMLGWLGLAVVGTLFMLWPAVLRTRMADSAPGCARRALAITAAGLTVAVAGQVLSARFASAHWVAALGMAGYAAGVAYALGPAVAEMRAKRPSTAAPVLLLAGCCWLLAALAVDVAGLVRGGDAAGDLLARYLVPMLGVGVVAQVLIGALSFILPVMIGGGPPGNRRMTAVLEYAWPVRVTAVNAGVLLLVAPAAGVSHAVGWTLAVAGTGSFPALVAAALLANRRPAAEASGAASSAVTGTATAVTSGVAPGAAAGLATGAASGLARVAASSAATGGTSGAASDSAAGAPPAPAPGATAARAPAAPADAPADASGDAPAPAAPAVPARVAPARAPGVPAALSVRGPDAGSPSAEDGSASAGEGGSASAAGAGSPSGPGDPRPRRRHPAPAEGRTALAVGSVVAVLGVLALIAVGAGAWPGTASGEAARHPAATALSGEPVAVTLDEFGITPAAIGVAPGADLVLAVHNAGRMSHDLVLDGGHGTRVLAPGGRQTVDLGVVTRDASAWCTVPGHRAAGMLLTIHVLRVSAAAAR